MSLIHKINNLEKYDYYIIICDNNGIEQTILLDHNDIIKTYSNDELMTKIKLEINLLNIFLNKIAIKQYTDTYINSIVPTKIAGTLLNEIHNIINNYHEIELNNIDIDTQTKCYIILKYSSIIRNNY
jgi:hypothetical protein